MELRAALIAKEKNVRLSMRQTTDQDELRRLFGYWRDLYDAVHGWQNDCNEMLG